jgi:hypothetical protein
MTVGTDMGAHPAAELLNSAAELTRKAAELLAADQVWTANNGDLITVLRSAEKVAAATEAVRLCAVREADVRGVAGEHGAPSTQGWLAQLLTLHPGEAKARVKAAEMLCRKAPAAMAKLAEGKVNPDQARAIARGLGKIEPHASAEEFIEAEAFLLQEGIGLHSGHITRLARHIEAVLDPDGDPERAEKALRSRGLTITNLGCGQHRLSGILTDEAAALLKAAIDPLAAPRPAADGERDTRTPAQRNHDALVEVCTQFLRWGELPQTRGARPHVHLTVNWDTLKYPAGDGGADGRPYSRVATGEELDPETVRKLCCDAGITPVILNTLGEPLNVGREHRTVTPAIWAGLVARDIGCIGEGCTRPASWCIAHHFPPWSENGITAVETCALLCNHEHDLVHHHGWEVRMAADGHPEMIPPRWVDPEQRPRRNAHWKLIRDGLKTEPHNSDEPDRGP